ncbi:hypothetical protein FACS1894204_13540 [Synergistales bacterium]|nr:hypothetical protein FACS1894204_13540 [Synergistales bacterium]
MTRKVISWAMAVLLVLLLSALVIAAVNEVLIASETSGNASLYELQGIQGADSTQNVASRKKARKAGKVAEEQELDTIQARKVQINLIVNTAQNVQKEYYSAKSNNLDSSSLRSDLERRIPEARSAFAEYKTLTERQLAILKSFGGDMAKTVIKIVSSKDFFLIHTPLGTSRGA